MENIDPLTTQQQIFLQRLLASHVITDSQAQKLYNEILNTHAQQHQGNSLGRDVKDTFRRINKSLKPAFRLEIKSVALALSLPKNDDEDDEDVNLTDRNPVGGNNGKPKSIVYHSIVNCDNDEVSKTAANPTFTKSPHELAYFRLLLEKFMERDNTTTSGNDITRGKGCTAYMSRMDLINLRLELTGLHKDKLTISQTENTLNLLERQGWLVPALPADDNNAMEEDMSSPNGRRSSRKNSSKSSSRNGESKYLQIGPRSYLEFPDHLIKSGLEDDKLPQFLLHG